MTSRPGPRTANRALGLVVALAVLGCRGERDPESDSDGEPFRDVAAETGLVFQHSNGMTGRYHMPEILSSGAALFDYDNDGDLDAYLVQGERVNPAESPDELLLPLPASQPPGDRLFRNDLVVSPDGSRELRFTDVTDQAGIAADGYGMGAAVGDFNNDGWTDLFVTNFGANRLYLNERGVFRDVSERLLEQRQQWSSSASLFDFDGDGWLDLFYANYVIFSVAGATECRTPNGSPDYCGPQVYQPDRDRLLHNRGDGTFEEVSLPSRVGTVRGAGLGAVWSDFSGDGRPDLYVANDQMANHYWVNRGNGVFSNEAMLAGAALNLAGEAEASMGVDAADFDDDGDDDLFMTHLRKQKNTLYVNDGAGNFVDETSHHGLDSPSRKATGFGAGWFDYDNDGLLDLFAANGAVHKHEALMREGGVYPFGEPNQLFRNVGDGRFIDAGEGEAFDIAEVSRGAAFGDIDNDGDTDILVSNSNGPARLLLNQVGQRRSWLGLRLVSAGGVRDVTGARVRLRQPGRSDRWSRSRTDGSYCSASDPRVLFGLGDEPEIEWVEVRWPDGKTEVWRDLAVNAYSTLEAGTGEPPGPASIP